MLRATAWTVGLFGAGAALARAFAVPWLEPLVLLALGLAFLLVSSRSGVRRPRTLTPRKPAAVARPESALGMERVPPPAPAPVVVEQSV